MENSEVLWQVSDQSMADSGDSDFCVLLCFLLPVICPVVAWLLRIRCARCRCIKCHPGTSAISASSFFRLGGQALEWSCCSVHNTLIFCLTVAFFAIVCEKFAFGCHHCSVLIVCVVRRYLDHYKLELARKRFGPAVSQSASMPDNSDTELDNIAKRARTEGGCSILTEPGTSGDVESNTPAVSELYGPLASRLQHDTGVLIQPPYKPDIDSGKDDGLQGSDTLIHAKVFPGEASLIHPSLLGI